MCVNCLTVVAPQLIPSTKKPKCARTALRKGEIFESILSYLTRKNIKGCTHLKQRIVEITTKSLSQFQEIIKFITTMHGHCQLINFTLRKLTN